MVTPNKLIAPNDSPSHMVG